MYRGVVERYKFNQEKTYVLPRDRDLTKKYISFCRDKKV